MGNEQLPQKVILMYEAVDQMIRNHRDLRTITVSEITKQAGIGKGTAYEYFKSKEEIVVSATMYAIGKRVAEVNELIGEEKGFKQSVLDVLIWIHDNLSDAKVYMKFLRMPQEDTDLMDCYHAELYKNHLNCESMRNAITLKLISIAQHEKLVSEQIDIRYMEIVVSLCFLGYVMYLDGTPIDDQNDKVYLKFYEHMLQGIANQK